MPTPSQLEHTAERPTGLDLLMARQVLEDQVRSQMFCPSTGRVLDIRKAVYFEVANKTTGTLVHRAVVTTAAYDRELADKVAKVESIGTHTVTVWDGRVLWGRRR